MNLNLLQILAISLSLSACGTLNTVVVDESVTKRKLTKSKTHCNSIPRFYSGVSYDFCLFHAEASTNPGAHHLNGTPLVAFDFVFSGVADTVVLPYTIYRQVTDGNIEIQ
ncbi:MAG: YceK/YidQ family lipoprotein [Alteromonadaceae bacterium]|nr:MAG: YceK/YidQ family lipoprotein [Alteromonadaceae bacterium]